MVIWGAKKASPLNVIIKVLNFVIKSASFEDNYHLVDIWVFVSLFVPLVFLFFAYSPPSLVEIILLVYGGWRIFDMIIYHINVVIFDELREKKKGLNGAILSSRRSLILVFANYLEVILWFALAYRTVGTPVSVCNAWRLSFVTMTSFGTTPLMELNKISTILNSIQSIIGF